MYVDVTENLRKLDALLNERCRIVLAGSAVPILAGCHFRSTKDINFAFLPPSQVATAIGRSDLRSVFDFQAQGVIGLFVDTEDRLVQVGLGLEHLEVERLSLLDWVVSKLASPKLDDVLNVQEVNLDMLLDIEHQFSKYCGISTDRAFSDLRYLISIF